MALALVAAGQLRDALRNRASRAGRAARPRHCGIQTAPGIERWAGSQGGLSGKSAGRRSASGDVDQHRLVLPPSGHRGASMSITAAPDRVWGV